VSFGNSTTAELPARTDQEKPLSAPLILDFDYTRSVGPVIGRFLTGLRDRRVVGVRGSDGRVFVPPQEYDPVTAQPLDEFVEVSSVGTVRSWTWVHDPLLGQPFDRPFAWALIQLDGADTSILHALDVASAKDITTGMRVRIEWSAERIGSIGDISCFVPGEDIESASQSTASDAEPVTMIVTPVHLEIDHSASYEESYYLRGLAEGKLLGGRTDANGKVYIPPRGANPTDGRPTTEQVELPDRGIVTTFCIVNVPFLGQRIKPPYIAAYVLLDGADIAFLHLILECDPTEVRMGMRVEAKWKPRDQWGQTLENIEYFRPTGEPDADYDTYKHHL
jgi:uncharacterized protein